jgi:hypothetical protein
MPIAYRRELAKMRIAVIALAGLAFAPLMIQGGNAAGNARVSQSKPEPLNNCFWELARGTGSDLVCAYPVWLADQERADMRRLTREMLQDAHCTVSIRIARSLLTHVLSEANYTFEAPAQPVECDLKTKDNTIIISATFAPRIIIKNAVAVDATPGMADVVVEYVNRSTTVRTEMLKMINSYLSLRVAKK